MILAENDAVQVVWHPGESDWLLCSFAALDFRPDGQRFWAQGPARRLGLNTLGFVGRENHWYPRAAMEALLPALRPVLERFPMRMTYGHSMGGHAALRCASLLGARRVLALMPQFALALADCEGQPHYWGNHYRPEWHADIAIRPDDLPPDALACLVADPLEPVDSHHARLSLGRLGKRLEWVKLHGFGHIGLAPLTGSAVAREIFAHLLAGDRAGLHSLVRRQRRLPQHRRGAHRYLAMSGLLSRRFRPRLAARLLAGMPGTLHGGNPRDHAQIRAQLALAAHRLGLACAEAEAWLDDDPLDSVMLQVMTLAAARGHAPLRAWHRLNQALLLAPGDATVRHHIDHLGWAMRDHATAPNGSGAGNPLG